MKRIFLCLFLSAACFQVVSAQGVTKSDMAAKANVVETTVAKGDATGAKAAVEDVLKQMKAVLDENKVRAGNAANEDEKKAALANMQKEISIYQQVWKMKNDVIANHATITMKISEFQAFLK